MLIIAFSHLFPLALTFSWNNTPSELLYGLITEYILIVLLHSVVQDLKPSNIVVKEDCSLKVIQSVLVKVPPTQLISREIRHVFYGDACCIFIALHPAYRV